MIRPCLDCRRPIREGSRCRACRERYRPRAEQQAFRDAVLARDRSCVDCGSTVDLEADHIVPLAAGGSFDPRNGATRCRRCHQAKVRRERARS